jgi:hypothetical protein
MEAASDEAYEPQEAPSERPTLPELDQTNRSVLNSLTSLQSRRSYRHAIENPMDWSCSETGPGIEPCCRAPISASIGGHEVAASTIKLTSG